MEPHPDPAGWEFRLTHVEWCCTFDGVVESEEGFVVPNRRVGSASTSLHKRWWRKQRRCSGVADPGARSGQGDLRGACVGAGRGADRPVFSCGLHQRPSHGADGGSPWQDIEEAVKLVRVEPIKDHITQQSLDVLKQEIVQPTQLVTVERIQDDIVEQMVDLPVPLVMGEIVAVVQEVVRLVPQERLQQIDEQIVKVPVPQVDVQEITNAIDK